MERCPIMLVTVAICTYNRAASLRRTLASLTTIRVSTGLSWELVVVNNNSSDHTDDVIAEFRDRLPLRREFEPKPGLSNARNRAVDVARGDYIIWTDDDVIVDSGWLEAYVEAFRRWPEAVLFGGRVIPRFEPPIPKWLKKSKTVLSDAFAARDFGKDYQLLSLAAGHLPFGASFAIRAIEQKQLRYDPNLGLAPNRRRYNDETDLFFRLLGSGAIGYWVPEATVEHCIGQERQTLHYITEFYMGKGDSEAVAGFAADAPPGLWFGVPRELWARLLLRGFAYHCLRFASPAPVWTAHLRSYAAVKGKFLYWWRKRR